MTLEYIQSNKVDITYINEYGDEVTDKGQLSAERVNESMNYCRFQLHFKRTRGTEELNMPSHICSDSEEIIKLFNDLGKNPSIFIDFSEASRKQKATRIGSHEFNPNKSSMF